MDERNYNTRSFIYTMIHELNVNQSHYQTSLQRLIGMYDRTLQQEHPARPFQNPIGTGRPANSPPITRFFESVVVRPTAQQITDACIECTAQQSDTILFCPITLDQFQLNERILKIRHCGHVFKRDALMSWFQRNVRCPVCRHDIRDSPQESMGSSSSVNSSSNQSEIQSLIQQEVTSLLGEESQTNSSSSVFLPLIVRAIQNIIRPNQVFVSVESETIDDDEDE